jgi:hypothetical protein
MTDWPLFRLILKLKFEKKNNTTAIAKLSQRTIAFLLPQLLRLADGSPPLGYVFDESIGLFSRLYFMR